MQTGSVANLHSKVIYSRMVGWPPLLMGGTYKQNEYKNKQYKRKYNLIYCVTIGGQCMQTINYKNKTNNNEKFLKEDS